MKTKKNYSGEVRKTENNGRSGVRQDGTWILRTEGEEEERQCDQIMIEKIGIYKSSKNLDNCKSKFHIFKLRI